MREAENRDVSTLSSINREERPMLRHIFQSAEFFVGAADYVHPDHESVTESGDDASRHVSIHRRIVILSTVFTVIGAASGVAMIAFSESGGRLKDEGAR